MRSRGSLFWGLALILLAGLLFIHQLGWLKGNVLGYFWPVLVIFFGIWLLVGVLPQRSSNETDGHTVSIPLENAHSARIKLDHGAGHLNVRSGAAASEALNGTFSGEVEWESRLEADRLAIKLRNAPYFWIWSPAHGLDWDIRLNGEIPLSLKIDSGASSSTLNLSDLKVVDLDIDTGASSTEVTLPAQAGNTHVDIDTGASSLIVYIPTGVAARIRIKSGVTSINIDMNRFPRLDGGLYQSTDYATAANRADITIDAGVGSIEVR